MPRVALAANRAGAGRSSPQSRVAQEQIAAAREQGADLILFPELSLTGYFLRDMVPDVAVAARCGRDRRTSRRRRASRLVVLGLCRAIGPASLLQLGPVGRGRACLHVHRKVYLPTYGMFEEQRYFAAGNRITACQSRRFGRVGLLVCEDFWHLSAVAILQAEQIDVLVCIANSPARGVDAEKVRTAEVYEQMAKTYARLLGAVVIFVNRVGFEDGLCFWGGSLVVGPDGTTLAEAPQFDPALTVVPVDLEELRRRG